MLIDEINALSERIDKLKKDEDIASEAEHFETRAMQIEQLAEQLHSPVAAIELLRNNGIETSVPAVPTGVISFAKKMKQVLDDDRKSVLSETSGFGQQFKSPLDNIARRTKASATSAWEKHVDENMPSVNHDLLSVLSKVKGFSDSVSAVQERLTECELHRTRTTIGADDIRNFNRALEELRKALDLLGSDELPDEVVRFLRSAGLHGFPLDQLTDEITGWIREHGLLGQFVVRTA